MDTCKNIPIVLFPSLSPSPPPHPPSSLPPFPLMSFILLSLLLPSLFLSLGDINLFLLLFLLSFFVCLVTRK